MNIIPLSQIKTIDFNIANIFSMFQHWKTNSVFSCIGKPRLTHGIIMFTGASGKYILKDGTEFKALLGEIVYLPEKSEYKIEFTRENTNRAATILINFSLFAENGEPFTIFDNVNKIPVSDIDFFRSSFEKIAFIANAPARSVPELKSRVFKLFHNIAESRYVSDITSPSFSLIRKGIEYLENDPHQTLSIDEVAALCNISGSYFRKIFYNYSGKTPSDFRIDRQIEHSKRLLETQLFTVSEISEKLGFSDVSYFSRLFKKRTGVSPLKYVNNL